MAALFLLSGLGAPVENQHQMVPTFPANNFKSCVSTAVEMKSQVCTNICNNAEKFACPSACRCMSMGKRALVPVPLSTKALAKIYTTATSFRRLAPKIHSLAPRDREDLIDSLVLGHLDRYQVAFECPTRRAEETLTCAYNMAARVARWGAGALHHTARGATGAERSALADEHPPPAVPAEKELQQLKVPELSLGSNPACLQNKPKAALTDRVTVSPCLPILVKKYCGCSILRWFSSSPGDSAYQKHSVQVFIRQA